MAGIDRNYRAWGAGVCGVAHSRMHRPNALPALSGRTRGMGFALAPARESRPGPREPSRTGTTGELLDGTPTLAHGASRGDAQGCGELSRYSRDGHE